MDYDFLYPDCFMMNQRERGRNILEHSPLVPESEMTYINGKGMVNTEIREVRIIE